MSRMPGFVDERFLEHRRRSSGHAGIAAAAFAVVLAYYRYVRDDVVRWDLLAVAGIFIVVKYALFFWYRRTD